MMTLFRSFLSWYLCPLLATSLVADDKRDSRSMTVKSVTTVHTPDGAHASFNAALVSLRRSELQTVESTNIPAPLTRKDLQRGQLAWRRAIKSVEVKFRYSAKRVLETPSDVEQNRRGALMPPDFTCDIDYATKGAKRYRSYQNLTPSTRPKEQVTPTYAPTVLVFRGDQSRTYDPERSLGTIRPGKETGVDSLGANYFEHVCLFFIGNEEDYKNAPYYVPRILGEDATYQLCPTLEKVDGFLCHVLSSGWHTLWVDHENGFSVRREVRFYPADKHQTSWGLNYIRICKDFLECDRGIFLPRKCFRTDYVRPYEPEAIRGKPHILISVLASDLHVNDVSDARFDLEFPSGSEVYDLINNKAFFVPHGEGRLDDAIAQARPIIDGIVVYDPPSKGRTWLWIANGTIAVLLGGAAIYRYLRRRRIETST